MADKGKHMADRAARGPPETGASTSERRMTLGDDGDVLPLSAALLVVTLMVGYARQGGFYPATQVLMAVPLVAAVLVLPSRSAQWRRNNSVLAAVGLGLAGWAVVSAFVNGDVRNAGGIVALLLGMAAAVAIGRSLTPGQCDTLAVALVALGCVVALTGWLGLVGVNPSWALGDELRRASTSLTYPNAAAGLLGPLSLYAIARAGSTRSTGAHAAVCMLLVGTMATLSRGGTLALAVGLVVLVALTGPRAVAHAAVPGALGATIALVGLAGTFSDVSPSPSRPVLGLTAGMLVTTLLARRNLLVTLTTVGVCSVVAAAAIAGGAAHFLVESDRWSLTSSDRHGSFHAALDLGRDNPLFGVGPGHAFTTWTDANGTILGSRFVHNEYAQTFAELGIPGLVLTICLIGVAAALVYRARPHATRPDLAAGALAALATFCAQSGCDFLWRVPALPLTVATLVGSASALPQPLRTTCPRHARRRDEQSGHALLALLGGPRTRLWTVHLPSTWKRGDS